MSGPRLAIGIVLFCGAVVVAFAQPAREALLALSPADGTAEPRTLYQYNDARGVVRFVERIEDVPPALRARAGRVEMERPVSGTALAPTPAARRSAKAAPPPRVARAQAPDDELPAWRRYESVVIYTTSWCPHCRDALADLDTRGVEYERKEIDTDIGAKSELKQRGGDTSVPQLFVDGRRIVGYSEQAYDGLFGKRR